METRVDEIADGIYRFSTFVPEIGPTGFTFNQFLIDDEQPLLFHTGPAGCSRSCPRRSPRSHRSSGLRWITFGHVEADECGAHERVPRSRAASRGRARRARLHGVAQRHGRSPATCRSRTARCSSSARIACATSTRPMCRTAGKRGCSTRRPPTRCCAATFQPARRRARAHDRRHRRAGGRGREHLRRDLHHPEAPGRPSASSPSSPPPPSP